MRILLCSFCLVLSLSASLAQLGLLPSRDAASPAAPPAPGGAEAFPLNWETVNYADGTSAETLRLKLGIDDPPIRTWQGYGDGGFWLIAGDHRVSVADQEAAFDRMPSLRASAWAGREVAWVQSRVGAGDGQIEFQLHSGPPTEHPSGYDRITDLDVVAPRGRILVMPNGDGAIEKTLDLPRGRYRARIARREQRSLGRGEMFSVELWPSRSPLPPRIVR